MLIGMSLKVGWRSQFWDIPRDVGIWGHPWNRDIPSWDVPEYIKIWGYPKTGMSLLLLKDIPTNIPSIYWDIPVSQINILWDIPISMKMSSGTSLLYCFFHLLQFNADSAANAMLSRYIKLARSKAHSSLHTTVCTSVQHIRVAGLLPAKIMKGFKITLSLCSE